MSTPTLPQHEVLVVGAGFGGIAAGVKLRKAGIDDFVIVDKHPSVGGTWFINKYPGVAVDIPSFIYSYSFAQTGNWSRLFAPGEELQQYAEDVVDQHGLRDKLRLSTTVLGSRFDEATDIWHVQTDRGEITARHVIVGIGGLEVPNLPNIPGIDTFAGKLQHTTEWDHDYDLTGKRVAVIGTGATALQLIPAIADQVSHLTVFQRTAIWVAPKLDFKTGPLTRFIFGNRLLRAPLRGAGMVLVELGLGGALLGGQLLGERLYKAVLQSVGLALRGWMWTQLPGEPELRKKLTPTYAFGCKRPSMHNEWFSTFTKPNVDLVTEPIERITEDSVFTADGVEHKIDVLVCATGFKVMEKGATPPFPCLGREGVDLNTWWDENRYQAYQGVTIPGWPNAYMLIGPWAYSPGSYLVLLESTVAHAVRAIKESRRRGATRCEVRREPHDKYWQQMLSRAAKSHLPTPLCAGSNTYYINYQGDAAAYRPSTNTEMRLQNRYFPFTDYEFTSVSEKNSVDLATSRGSA